MADDGEWIYAYNHYEKSIKIVKIPVRTGKFEQLVTLPFEKERGISMTLMASALFAR